MRHILSHQSPICLLGAHKPAVLLLQVVSGLQQKLNSTAGQLESSTTARQLPASLHLLLHTPADFSALLIYHWAMFGPHVLNKQQGLCRLPLLAAACAVGFSVPAAPYWLDLLATRFAMFSSVIHTRTNHWLVSGCIASILFEQTSTLAKSASMPNCSARRLKST